MNEGLIREGLRQRFSVNEKGAWVLYPVPADESEWKAFLATLSKTIESLPDVKREMEKPATGKLHVKQWVSRISFRADCSECGGERLFQYENPYGEGHAWYCNTDHMKKHGVKTENLDSPHPDWKNRPIPS